MCANAKIRHLTGENSYFDGCVARTRNVLKRESMS